MKQIILLLILFIAGMATAQEEEKKVIKTEKIVKVEVQNDSKSDKTVNVNVDEDDDERTVTIKTIENGNEKVIKWKDNGEIPEEIQKQLKENNIDIQMLDGEGAMFIGDGYHKDKRVIVIDDGDGESVEWEWDGEGEMPDNIKEMMKEYEIDLGSLKEDSKGKKMKMRMMKMDRGHRRPHRIHMKGGDNVWVAKKEMSKTYMGAQIGTADSGTEILDVMVDSPAHKAGLKKGDIITEINGANTKNVDDMMTLLSLFDVDDTVEVSYTRDGKTKTVKVKLAERPKPYR